MKGLSREFCEKIALARREAGISQTELAAEIGCKQSALSPFERGDGTKLSDEAVQKLSAKFGIPLPSKDDNLHHSTLLVPTSTLPPASGFCPNPDCPSHRKVQAAGKAIIIPDRKLSDPVGGRFCALCGEVLERKCPNCGSPVHEGAVCSFCGKPYVV